MNRMQDAQKAKKSEKKATVLINMAIFAKYYTGSLTDTQKAMSKDGFEVSVATLMRYAAEPEFSEMVINANRHKEGIAQAEQVKCLMSRWMFTQEDPSLRMRAAENVARMHGLFLDKLQVDDKLSLTQALDELLKKDTDERGMTEEVSLADVPDDSQPAPKPKKKKK